MTFGHNRSVNNIYENYWSDYSGTDANRDGVGDTPYIIDSNNQDNYPIILPIDVPTELPTPSHSTSPSPTPSSSVPEFPNWVFVLQVIVAVSAGLLVYFKKRRH